MIIYGSTLSPFVRKVVAVANEKSLTYEVKPIGIGDRDPAFLAVSPLGKMPAIDDEGYGLADSSAICHYLDAQYPQPALIPADPRLRGRTIWYEEFADTVLFACGATIFFNRIVAPRFLGREGDLTAADKAERETLPPLLDYLEGVVPESGGFLVGDALTLADIAVASPFANLEHAGVRIDAATYPRLTAYTAAILARPSLAHAIERERGFLAKAL